MQRKDNRLMCMDGCGHGKEGAAKGVNDIESMFPQHPHPPPSIGIPSLLSPTPCCNPTVFFHQLLPHSIYNPTSHCGAAYYCNILGFTRPTFCNAASSWPAALGSVPWVVAVCWVLLPGNVMVTMMWPGCFAPAQNSPFLGASQSCGNMCE